MVEYARSTMRRHVSEMAAVGVAVLVGGACHANVEISARNAEVVVAQTAPKVVAFAAEEMTNFLSRVFSRAVPIVDRPTPGRSSIVLGSNEWAVAAGIATERLARDEFVIAARDGKVFVAGRDDPAADERHAIFGRTGVWDQLHERATLFGVYGFLERFAGVRMYFPGELGEIVPAKDCVSVPDGTLAVRPDYAARSYSAFSDGAYFEGEDRDNMLHPMRKLNYARNRMQTMYIPCNHGQTGFRFLERFADSHPEYFAMRADGTRWADGRGGKLKGQLCHSSSAWDVMYDDIVSYARGEPPSVRGMGSWRGKSDTRHDWAIKTFRRPWVDVMPQDGFNACHCEKCQAAYNMAEPDYADALVWRRTAELAGKLAAACPGMRITQMAYPPYRRVPDVDLPGNVDVMVAVTGPWSNERQKTRDEAVIRSWTEKLGHKVWLWNYACKFGANRIPNVPNWSPRAWGSYYKSVAPLVFGAYCESNNDRWLYNYLSYYVFGRVCWDNRADIDGIIDEHYRLMYGRAAGEMQRFFEEVEDKWVVGVSGKSVDTDMGPTHVVPSPYEIYTRIYSPEVLSGWRARLGRAESLVERGSLESRRIELVRREMLEPLVDDASAYCDSVSVEKELARRAANPGRRNILTCENFTGSPFKEGWCVNERGYERYYEQVGDAPPGLPGSIRLRKGASDPNPIRLVQYIGKGGLTSGKRYRISLFLKLDNVVQNKRLFGGGGVGVYLQNTVKQNVSFPQNRLTGTTGWFHQAWEFTAVEGSEDSTNKVQLDLWSGIGTVYFTGVRLEEL